MEVKNHMEYVVEKLLPALLKKYPEICQCEQCVADVKAICLNKLPPKYFATEQGEVFNKANELTVQFEADVVRAIIESVEMVKRKPRH